jgi:hypothetical protein
MTYDEFAEHELAEKQWIESHSAVLAASPVVVRIERWKSDRGLWWNRGGLALFVRGFGIEGVTQTYRSRSIDDARDMVIDYLRCRNIDVPDDVEILWAEDSR